MNSYKKLFSNSIIFALGNLGLNIVNIVLVPMFTYYFSTEEYGKMDIISTTVYLLLPVVSLSIFEAAFRFVFESDATSKQVFSNSLLITTVGSAILLIVSPAFSFVPIFKGYIFLMCLLLIVQVYQSLLAQFCRAIGYVKLFAFNGILLAVFLGVLNIIFIAVLHLGLSGYLMAMIISYTTSIFIFLFVGKMWVYIDVISINKKLITQLLRYSIPLIPNSILWWLINASNRYFILFFLGASANGLFAVANKVPAVLTMISQIFSQAWQISAIEERKKDNRDNFYSQVFNFLVYGLFLAASLILTILKIVLFYLIDKNFYSSWEYIPFLLLGAIFSSFSAFYGVNYLVAQKTMGVLKTSIVGAIANLMFNFIFLPILGLNGASLSTMLSFLTMWLLRIWDSKKIVSIKVNWKNFLFLLSIILVQIVNLYLNIDTGEMVVNLGCNLLILSWGIYYLRKLKIDLKIFIKR